MWIAADCETAAANVSGWLRARSFHVQGVLWFAAGPLPNRCAELSVRAPGRASGDEWAVMASRRHRLDHLVRLQDGGWSLAGVVHPSAQIASSSSVHPSCLVGPEATVGHDAALWTSVLVDQGAQIGAGTIIEDAVVAAGADVGTGARICAGSRIGENAVIAEGAFVPPRAVIEQGTTFTG